MVSDFRIWPVNILRPSSITVKQNAFTRSGGRSLSGITRTVRTDRGHFSFEYSGVILNSTSKRRKIISMRTDLNGRVGLVAIPIWSYDLAPWAEGTYLGRTTVPWSDLTTFSDGSFWSQPTINVELAVAAALHDTSMVLRLVSGIDSLEGVRFSYENALYETGKPTDITDDLWTVPIFPDIRAPIPINASLEFDRPTCLVHLASDNELDYEHSASGIDKLNIAFVEAVDYWNDLATV